MLLFEGCSSSCWVLTGRTIRYYHLNSCRFKRRKIKLKFPSQLEFCVLQNRRWSSAQAREFLHLHNTLALVVLHTDLASQRTESKHTDSAPCIKCTNNWIDQCLAGAVSLTLCYMHTAPATFKRSSSGLVSLTSLLPLHPDVNTLLFKPEGQPYLTEVSNTLINTSSDLVVGLGTACAD